MNYRRLFPLAAVLLMGAGCFNETRKGLITLTGAAPIPLNGRSGPAQLVAGSAEVTFKKGSNDHAIEIRVRQANRPDVEFEAAVSGDYTSGNFTLRGADIGQPVDMVSARAYAVTGPTERYTDREDRGNGSCLVDVRYDPCDENWTVGFKDAAGAELGSFASRRGTRCNEQRGFPYACHRDPMGPGPRHGMIYERVNEIGAANLNFD